MATVFTREQFEWIVTQHATFIPSDTIVEEFGKRWKDTACELSDVERGKRENLPEEWIEFFDRKANEFLNAPTADVRVRIGELHRMFVFARDRRAVDQASKLLAQIAGEIAPKGAGKPGAPGAVDPADPVDEIRVTIIDPKAPETVSA